MNRQQQKAEEKLQELAAAIDNWRISRRGKGHSEAPVRRKIKTWTAREHLQDFLDVELETEKGKVTRIQWHWDRERKREVQRRHLGKQVLVTDRDDWDNESIVTAYRRLTRTERLFRTSKSATRLWWPMFHWTDSKIRVHALYTFFVLLLLAIARRELWEAGVHMDIDRATERLRRIQESVVVYANGSADRVLAEMDGTQCRLAEVLGVTDLARQLGITLLAPP